MGGPVSHAPMNQEERGVLSEDGRLDAAAVSIPRTSALYRLPEAAGLLGVAALGAALAMGFGGEERQQFLFSYLVSYLFWLSIALGALFFVVLQFATRAGWSVVVRRLAENLMAPMPLFLVLFVPLALGLRDLYPWTNAEAVAEDALLRGKAPYLNETFFYVRAAGYFVLWTALALFYHHQSLGQDQDGQHARTRRMQWWSGPSILLFALSVTFAAFDWIMSLDPHWYSTMYGVYFFAGSILSAFATLGLMAALLRRAGVLKGVVTVEHFHDLGKLMFGFTVFWAYIAFSQYFLYWYANIPEETIWFAHRWEGSWKTVTLVLGGGHFVIPFFFLLPRSVKRSTPALVAAALWLLAAHAVDLYWQIMPVLHPHGAHVGLQDALTFVGVGGLYVGAVARLARKRACAPTRDPRLAESLHFENV